MRSLRAGIPPLSAHFNWASVWPDRTNLPEVEGERERERERLCQREGGVGESCQPVSLPVYPGWASLASVPSGQLGDGWIAVKGEWRGGLWAACQTSALGRDADAPRFQSLY